MNHEELQQFNKAKNTYDFFENIKRNGDIASLIEIVKEFNNRISEIDFDMIDKLERKFDETVKEIKTSVPDLNTMFKSVKGNTGDQGEKGERGDRGERGEIGKSVAGPKGDKGDFVRGDKGDKGDIGERGIQGLNGADGSPDTGQMIVSKLETLDEEDKLKIESIKNLRDELDKLEKKMKSSGVVSYGGGGGGGAVKSYNLSSQLNGILKTFSLPAFDYIIQVHSYPDNLEETVDWTSDRSNFTVTFTSAVDAETTLSVGQKIYLTYAEL